MTREMAREKVIDQCPVRFRDLDALDVFLRDEQGHFWRQQLEVQAPVETRDEGLDSNLLVMSMSSEMPIRYWWLEETMLHSEEAADFSRVAAGAAPLLFNHERDNYLGVIERVWLEGKRSYCEARFSNREFAQEVLRDVRAKVLQSCSIAARVVDYDYKKATKKGEPDKVTVTKWQLLENSIVTVPADMTVGPMRSLGDRGLGFQRYFDLGKAKEVKVDENKKSGESTAVVDRDEILRIERERTANIQALARRYAIPEKLSREWIDEGLTFDQCRGQVLDFQDQRGQKQEVISWENSSVEEPVQPLGLSRKDQQRFSVLRAIRYQAGMIPAEEAGHEIEVSRAIAGQLGKEPIDKELFIPTADLERWVSPDLYRSAMGHPATAALLEQRAYNTIAPFLRRDSYSTTTSASGGALIETILDSSNFIDVLRNEALVLRLGARVFTGLSGNLDVPVRTGVTGWYWVEEGANIPESRGSFDILKFRPHDMAVINAVTERQLMQSDISNMEALIRMDIAEEMALGLDSTCIKGSGVGEEPLGILNFPNAQVVEVGPNGGPVEWQHATAMAAKAALVNARRSTCAYLTNPLVEFGLRNTQKFVGNSNEIWQQPLDGGELGNLAGYRAGSTNQIPSNLTKGTGTELSAMIFACFSRLMIAQWSALRIRANPYGRGWTQNMLDIKGTMTLDIKPERQNRFVVMKDIDAAISV